jgi:DNA-directed RNA polymerase beta subunit
MIAPPGGANTRDMTVFPFNASGPEAVSLLLKPVGVPRRMKIGAIFKRRKKND